ncbi:MAG: hypothetical protein ACXVJZ_14255 [Acidimicrobiia bacterium]
MTTTTTDGAGTGPSRRRRWIALGLAIAVVLGGGIAVAAAVSDDDASTATPRPSTSSTSATGATAMRGATTTATDVCGDVPGAMRMDDGMVMAPVPTRAPSAQDRAAATALAQKVADGIQRFSTLSDAVAAGYVPATNPRGYVVHYADWNTVRSGDVLDATHPSSLVYANTFTGPVLLGAMFMGPGPCEPGPDVAGPLTQWHAHANLCLSATHQVVGNTDATGSCAVGRHNLATYFMLHVWVAPSLASTHQFEAHVSRATVANIIRTGRG